MSELSIQGGEHLKSGSFEKLLKAETFPDKLLRKKTNVQEYVVVNFFKKPEETEEEAFLRFIDVEHKDANDNKAKIFNDLYAKLLSSNPELKVSELGDLIGKQMFLQ